MLKKPLVLLLCFTAFVPVAWAQEGEQVLKTLDSQGTIKVANLSDMSDPQRPSCQIHFTQALSRKKPETLLSIDGFYTLSATSKGVIAGFLLEVMHIDRTKTPPVGQASAPTMADIITDDGATSARHTLNGNSDETNGRYVAFLDNEIGPIITADVVQRKSINFIFNQADLKEPVFITVDLTVTDTDKQGKEIHSDSEINAFTDCWLKLVRQPGAKKPVEVPKK